MTTPTFSAIATSVRRFLTWWVTELAGMIPSRWLWSSNPSGRCRLIIGGDGVAIERITTDAAERFEEERSFDELDSQTLDQLAELSGGDVSLLLAEPEILILPIQLPRAARSHMRSAVALKLAERSPIAPEHLSWMIAREVSDGDRVTIDVAMARTERLDAISGQLSGRGIGVSSIAALAPFGEIAFPRPFDLVSRTREWAASRLTLLICAGLLLTIPITCWAGATLLAVKAEWRLSATSAELRALRAERRAAEQLEKERRRLMPTSGQPGASTILNAIAAVLPPTDWLRAIERHQDGSLLLVIVSHDESILDDQLRKSALLPGARVTERSELDHGTVELIYRADRP